MVLLDRRNGEWPDEKCLLRSTLFGLARDPFYVGGSGCLCLALPRSGGRPWKALGTQCRNCGRGTSPFLGYHPVSRISALVGLGNPCGWPFLDLHYVARDPAQFKGRRYSLARDVLFPGCIEKK